MHCLGHLIAQTWPSLPYTKALQLLLWSLKCTKSVTLSWSIDCTYIVTITLHQSDALSCPLYMLHNYRNEFHIRTKTHNGTLRHVQLTCRGSQSSQDNVTVWLILTTVVEAAG